MASLHFFPFWVLPPERIICSKLRGCCVDCGCACCCWSGVGPEAIPFSSVPDAPAARLSPPLLLLLLAAGAAAATPVVLPLPLLRTDRVAEGGKAKRDPDPPAPPVAAPPQLLRRLLRAEEGSAKLSAKAPSSDMVGLGSWK